ncbi:MAG: HD-GYP domain-containing protein [Halanaerobiaceae bacterium]
MEKTIKLSTNNLKQGYRLARNVKHKYGSIVLPAETILDKEKIHRLQRMDLKQVTVYREQKEKREKNIEKNKNLEKNYYLSVNEVDSMFHQIKEKEKIAVTRINDLIDKITNLGQDNEMIDLLIKLRNANKYPYHHLLNMGILGYMFGKWLNLNKKRCIDLTYAGLLHDAGMAFIPENILYKPGNLTKKEYEKIKQHPKKGYKLVENLNFISRETAQGILTHHERYDGSGYPLHLEGENIPLFGRILAIIDTFNALTSERVYQPRISPFEAIKLFREDTLGAFDYNLVDIFLRKIPDYFVNKKVFLNDGREAEVVFINPRHPDKPIVKINDQYIDLYQNKEIKIEGLSKKII